MSGASAASGGRARTEDVEADTQAAPARAVPDGPWPHGVSREPTMRISDVLGDLQGEFPALTPSKLRFLEEQGLVEPRRTASRYRLYSLGDVERLRYVLRQQRDRYLPLRVIKDQLGALDAGAQSEPLTPRLAASDGERATAPAARTTIAALAAATGVEEAFVQRLVDDGVLTASSSGHVGLGAHEVVVVAAALAEHGVDTRHLRSFRAAAERQLSVVDQIVAPMRAQRAVSANARAAALAAEVGELCARLHTAMLRSGVAELDR